MKGIYLTEELILSKGSGVAVKIMNQVSVFEDNGIQIELISGTPSGKLKQLCDKMLRFVSFIPDYRNNSIMKRVKNLSLDNYDFIYIRKLLMGKCLLKKLKEIRQQYPVLKVYMEIPTFPYDSEMTSCLRKKDLRRELKVRNQFVDVIDKIVTFSDDEKIFGINTIRIVNGVDYNKISIIKSHEKADTVNFIAVALFDSWHGYDRFIEGMKQYYKNKGEKNIVLHLVGDGPALESYKQLVEQSVIGDHVRFYGKLSGKELDEVYESADIALDAMGRHRSGVFFNSSLKGKEYCAKGLPIVSGVRTELDDFQNYPFYLRVPADDSAIDMKEMIDFYEKIYGGECQENFRQEIRNITKAFFDIRNTFLPVIQSLKQENR